MKAVCPNNPEHKTFLTTAHVQELWEVDSNGNFERVVETIQTVHQPDPDNEWTCSECDAQAIVTR